MASILEKFDLNGTYFIQLALFIVVFLVLNHLYFRPFYQLLKMRDQKMVKDKKEAEDLVRKAEERYAEYASKIELAKQEARKAYEQVLISARSEEMTILDQARKDVKEIHQKSSQEYEVNYRELFQGLEKEVGRYATELVDRIMSDKADKPNLGN